MFKRKMESQIHQKLSVVVQCVNEIETRGLTEIDLYRISGSDRDVKALREKFVS